MAYTFPDFDTVIAYGVRLIKQFQDKGDKRVLEEGIELLQECPVPDFDGTIIGDYNIPYKLTSDYFNQNQTQGYNPLATIVTIIIQMGWFCGYKAALEKYADTIEDGRKLRSNTKLYILSLESTEDEIREFYDIYRARRDANPL